MKTPEPDIYSGGVVLRSRQQSREWVDTKKHLDQFQRTSLLGNPMFSMRENPNKLAAQREKRVTEREMRLANYSLPTIQDDIARDILRDKQADHFYYSKKHPTGKLWNNYKDPSLTRYRPCPAALMSRYDKFDALPTEKKEAIWAERKSASGQIFRGIMHGSMQNNINKTLKRRLSKGRQTIVENRKDKIYAKIKGSEGAHGKSNTLSGSGTEDDHGRSLLSSAGGDGGRSHLSSAGSAKPILKQDTSAT